MSTKKTDSSKPGRHLEESREKISQHKKSIDASSSKLKKANKTEGKQNIEKTGPGHDDWNDPTGNSHISSSGK